MPEAALTPGSTLDRYELLCPLAEGGMATVWLARMHGKRGFEKLVAIKTIRAELVDDPRFEEMFLDEARIASGITHPNVAQIIDLGEKSGILYLVMEWVDGESLAKVRKFAAKARVRLPLGLALRVIADACAGLQAAHELKGSDGELMGVVHRDVSPQNILISIAGAVKIIDFGIAKAQNRLGTRTRTGVVKGKVQYMAPEQARGDPHDRRVDIWALGVCLYELVTDRLPFDGDNPLEVLGRITTEDPPPIEEVIPDSVREIVARALARRPEDRFPTASAMRRSIEQALAHLGLSSSPEDVASFLDAYMPQRAAERKEVVSQALRAADARGPLAVDAFTGTMEVQRGPRESGGRLRSPSSANLAGRASQNTPPHTPANLRASRPAAPAFSARALIEEERPSRAPLVGMILVLALGGAAYLAWRFNPDGVEGLMSNLGGGVGTLVVAPVASVPAASSAPAGSSSAPSPSASEAASAEIEGDAAPAPSASAAETAATSASAAPSASAQRRRHGWPSPPPRDPGGPPPRNTDWLPKESEIPQIAPKPPDPPQN